MNAHGPMNAQELPAVGPLRVALVSTQSAWHGGEDQAQLLAHGLRGRGHECLILARDGGRFASRMSEQGFAVVPLPAGRPLQACRELRRAVRSWQPQIVHFNDAHAVTRGGLALLGVGQPVRVAARRVDFPIRSALAYQRFCDRVICVSRAVAEVCRRRGLPAHRLRVVHDGVDPRRARSGNRQLGRAALGLEDQDVLLLTVAKLTDHKGHCDLIAALPEVVRRIPRVCLALAGDGELAACLRQQAEQLGVASHVRWLGFRHDVPDLLHAADLFVLPSRMEGLCTSLIDAMLAGRPIVTTTAGGIPDLVSPDLVSSRVANPNLAQTNLAQTNLAQTNLAQTNLARGDRGPLRRLAWSVPPGDPAALAAAILDAWSDPRERAERASRAQRRAELRFLAHHMVEATVNVYRELLAERQQPMLFGVRLAA